MQYRYSFLSHGVQVNWQDGTAGSHATELGEWANHVISEAASHLEEIQGGGWEILSHHILRTDDGAILSLVARQATK